VQATVPCGSFYGAHEVCRQIPERSAPRSYRENASSGRLTFGRGFAVGILITLLSNLCYLATWELVYFKFMPDFADKYAAYMIARDKSSGASQEKMEKSTREAKQFKEMYNPLMNVALTFAEVFPIGLGVTLLSAAIEKASKRGDVNAAWDFDYRAPKCRRKLSGLAFGGSCTR